MKPSIGILGRELAVIQDDLQYAAYLDEARHLSSLDPDRNSDEGRRLGLLSVLVERYELERFPISAPDPISAIMFRMTELGLKKKDLGEILGSQPRATEIMSGKRPLTLEMIRKLHMTLRIPAEVLIAREQGSVSPVASELDLGAFPVKEMVRRGWIDADNAAKDARTAVQEFLSAISGDLLPVFLRRSVHGNVTPGTKEKLYAWLARVVFKGRETGLGQRKYIPGCVTPDFIADIAKLSAAPQGPRIACEYLARRGIPLVIEPAIAGTKVDGAVVIDEDGTPIVGIAVRHDRVDSFWFTLAHELAHISLHSGKLGVTFVDDTETNSDDDRLEQEANALALEALIPQAIWRYSAANRTRDTTAIRNLARELCISEAIVAGRIRRESGNYRILTSLLGQGEVRKQFPETKWELNNG